MHDVAGMSLESTNQSERAEAVTDEASVESESTKVLGAVVVTTTIQRESKPGAAFEEIAMESGYSARTHPRPISGADVFGGDSYVRTNQTKISAGRSR